MAQQSFIWTVLPNGYTPDGKSLRVSILLSPRLNPIKPDSLPPSPPKLGSFFPDWEDWPQTLKKATFKITYGGTTVAIPLTQITGKNCVDTSLGESDSVVWKAVFKPHLFVRGFEYKDLSDNVVLSYDTTTIVSLVEKLYTKMAKSANGEMPHVSDIVNNPDWADLVSTVHEMDLRFTHQKNESGDDPTKPRDPTEAGDPTGLRDPSKQFKEFFYNRLSDDDPLAETLARFQLFHTPPAKPDYIIDKKRTKRTDDSRINSRWLEYTQTKMPEKKDLGKQLDFHQIIAAMNPYPSMLRRLGIVVDLILDVTLFKKAPDERLSVKVNFPDGVLIVPRTADASPTTRTLLSDTKFQAVSSPSLKQDDIRVIDGLLDINPSQYDIVQLDVDSTGLKLMNFARTLARLVPDDARIDPVTRFEKGLGVPSLRNVGFMLVHRNRWSMLENKFEANKSMNTSTEAVFNHPAATPPATPPDLWAEDLVRGYRIDIWDSTTAVWRSLCLRDATYDLEGMILKPNKVEEGTLRLGATKSSDPTSNEKLVYLHEAIMSWTGWSLAAPPPGRAIQRDGTVDTAEATLPPGLKFKTKFKALPGSLPRLRLGHKYWIRARVVDLAANSLSPQENDFGPENPQGNSRPYLRYEPVAAPIIALFRPNGEGTEIPAEGESMERIAIRSFNDIPTDDTPTKQFARRFALPPQSSVRDAEVHGKLDVGSKLDKSKFTVLANQKDDPKMTLIEEKIKTQSPLGETPVDETPVETTFTVYEEGTELTYLADPIAENVAVRIFDHPYISNDEVLTVPLYPIGSWPDAKPFNIRVFEHPTDKSARPTFDEGTRTLLIPLPKGVRAKVRLSMQPSKEWLKQMGVWMWLTKADKRKLEKIAFTGQLWMLTPWRTVEVVHAVQRPLIEPELVELKVSRLYASTSAMPEFVATCSLRSTDRLDLCAEWHEPRDDPADTESEKFQVDIRRVDVAFMVKITDPKSYAMRNLGHKLGGIPEHIIIDEDLIGVNIGKQGFIDKNHEFHDTRYRRVEYWLEGTTKFREFLSRDIITETKIIGGKPELEQTDKNIKAAGPHAITWIRSSASPPAPNVLYVVPTFGWVRIVDDKGDQSSWRRGGGLRIYLNRPWNVSGYGEMLAVVLPTSSFEGNPELEPKKRPYKNYVTQWGNDPIWHSPFVDGIAPKRLDFPLARTAPDEHRSWLPENAHPDEKYQPPGPFKVTELHLPDDPYLAVDVEVEVAPHDVFYDKDRRLWYCDIEIDNVPAYYPFIRLALARYQPVSVDGAHLSNIVLTDFMPLTANRWLNVTHTDDVKIRHVAVYGNHYSDSSGHVEAKDAPSMSLMNRVTYETRTLVPVDLSPTSIFEVWVERLNEQIGEDFGWERVADSSVRSTSMLERQAGSIKSVHEKLRARELLRKRKFDILIREGLMESVFVAAPLWEGNVTVTEVESTVRHRLVIAEYEEYIIDDDTPYDEVPEKKGRRLVFIEHVELR